MSDALSGSGLGRVNEPSLWPAAPKRFSFSLLSTLRSCPRKWQLANAIFDEWEGLYPRPYAKPAVLGQIVHDLLQSLVGWLVKHGSPAFNTSEFAQAMQSFQLRERIKIDMEKQLALLKKNPRAQRVRTLGFEAIDVQNKVFHLLRSTWSGKSNPDKADEATGFENLAEEWVGHANLPLGGYLDLVEVRPYGDIITDYKTGEMSDSYRHQILIYALLWWRREGRLPSLLRVVAASGEILELSPTEAELEALESELTAELQLWTDLLASPASPSVSEETCRYCHVRAHCGAYWDCSAATVANSDLECTVTKVRSSSSFSALAGEAPLEVTATRGADLDLARLMAGDRIRLLSVTAGDDGSVALAPYSELFVVPLTNP